MSDLKCQWIISIKFVVHVLHTNTCYSQTVYKKEIYKPTCRKPDSDHEQCLPDLSTSDFHACDEKQRLINHFCVECVPFIQMAPFYP